MSIAFSAISTAAVGTTSAAPTWPSVASGNLALCLVTSKYQYPTSTPSGFTLLAQANAGAGSSGVDTGNAYSSVYYKICDGTETGTLTVTSTGGNSIIARIAIYTKTATDWSLASTTGSDTTVDTTWSATGAADPGGVANDILVVCRSANTDGAAFAGTTLTWTGITFGTLNVRANSGTTQGDDCAMVVIDRAVSSGTSSGAPVDGGTDTVVVSGSSPAGAVVFARIREYTTYTSTASETLGTWSDSDAVVMTTAAVPDAETLGTWSDSSGAVFTGTVTPTETLGTWSDSTDEIVTTAGIASETFGTWSDSDDAIMTTAGVASETLGTWSDSTDAVYTGAPSPDETLTWSDSTDAVYTGAPSPDETLTWSDATDAVFTGAPSPDETLTWSNSSGTKLTTTAEPAADTWLPSESADNSITAVIGLPESWTWSTSNGVFNDYVVDVNESMAWSLQRVHAGQFSFDWIAGAEAVNEDFIGEA
jgi:hypothetical protein